MPSRPARPRASLFNAALFLGLCALAGMAANQRLHAQSATDESQLRDSLHQFTDVYAIVEQNYATPFTADAVDKSIYDGAIPSMLHTLDPHSNFFDPKAYRDMREEQHGHYYGVGMTIQPQNNKIVVVAPFEGTPAYRAGIRPGDVILTIDGKPTDGLDSAAVAGMLKGPKGTHVLVVMGREGEPKPLTFDLIRDEIPRYSVDLAYFLRPGIAYIHITNFQETTGREFSDALDRLGDIHGLVLDLRGNPGGLLNEAVAVTDKFLAKGQVVVSQHGRGGPDQVYRTSVGEQGAHFPIVVLVNRNTASAAEIVTGALQDHDRALVVGETTFGKGLVQTVYPVAEDTGLALTTYHYYTPSGRLIQRNYDNVSMYDYFYLRDSATLPADNKNREVKLTDSGRTVYGGGGITPDEHIDPPKPTHFQDSLLQHYAFFNFSKHYLASHTVTRDFTVDDATLKLFRQFLVDQKIDAADADFAAPGVLDWVKASIKGELFTSVFGQVEGTKVRVEWDPSVQKAITFLPEAQTLEDHAHQAMLQSESVASTQ